MFWGKSNRWSAKHHSSSRQMICRDSCRVCPWSRPLFLSVALVLLLPIPVSLAADVLDPNATEQAKMILADQIREQGNACVKAEEAHRDAAFSKPDEPVWILKCSNAVYRIRLRGNMAATVEVVDSYP